MPSGAPGVAFHLGTGETWLGMPVPQPRRVLLIESEGPRPLVGALSRSASGAQRVPPESNRARPHTP